MLLAYAEIHNIMSILRSTARGDAKINHHKPIPPHHLKAMHAAVAAMP